MNEKMDNETNPEPNVDIPVPVKTVSEKQYKHLARAREIKKIKGDIKNENKKFVLDQLSHINTQINLVGTQVSTLINKFDTHMENGGMKRKREETEEEKKIVEPPAKLEEKKDAVGEGSRESEPQQSDGNYWDGYMVGAAKLVGGFLALATLYGYRKVRENHEAASEYWYKNIA